MFISGYRKAKETVKCIRRGMYFLILSIYVLRTNCMQSIKVIVYLASTSLGHPDNIENELICMVRWIVVENRH